MSTRATPAADGHAGAPPGLQRSVTGPLLFLFILGDVLGAGVYVLDIASCVLLGALSTALRRRSPRGPRPPAPPTAPSAR